LIFNKEDAFIHQEAKIHNRGDLTPGATKMKQTPFTRANKMDFGTKIKGQNFTMFNFGIKRATFYYV